MINRNLYYPFYYYLRGNGINANFKWSFDRTIYKTTLIKLHNFIFLSYNSKNI